MRSLSYVCASTGETIPLEGPDIWAQTADGLRGREWSYTIGYRSLTGVSRTAREAELDLTYVRCPEKVDSTRRLFDADPDLHELEVQRAGLADAFLELTRTTDDSTVEQKEAA